jgi:hypothetical protein
MYSMNNHLNLKSELTAACGLYLATQEKDHEKILHYAVVLNQSFEETMCDGCGASRKSMHCSTMCFFIACKQEKGVHSCTDCKEFPCNAMHEFKSKMPHRMEIIESLSRLKEIGQEQWLLEKRDHFLCHNCNTVNSPYHVACRKCGNLPSCSFVAQHKETIEQYLSR